MKRIFHPWNLWEDYKHGFYGGVEYQKDGTKELYASLLRDLPRFEAALQTILATWHYSCEHNLTNEALNRIAYLGQASCALIYNVPSNVSMSGFNLLSAEEQAAANAMAQKYLDLWIKEHEGVNTQKVS
jgi:hypothetical protein